MRIQRLDLLRYGKFTDIELELPASQQDFHILFGPNEAGKTTALSAIEDLLFGIPESSPYNFLHDYRSLRIGALLQDQSAVFEFRRRKGRKDTILDAGDAPLANGGALVASLLQGIGRPFFTRMFCLDHKRLHEGGQEILQAQGDAGQTIFAASAGMSGLRGDLQSLDDEADGLWSTRKAAHRKFYQAEERLKSAEAELRTHSVSAAKWQEARLVCDNAEAAYDELERTLERVAAEQRKLSRIRRVYRDVKELMVLRHQIAALGEVIPLPENAASDLETAERELRDSAARADTLKGEREREIARHGALAPNDDILLRADDIRRLHARRIEVQKEKADLPHRQAELAAAERELRRLAEGLAWHAEDVQGLIAKIPPRAKLVSVRALLNARGEKASTVANAKERVKEIVTQIAERQGELDAQSAPPDLASLTAILKAARAGAVLPSRVGAAGLTLDGYRDGIQRQLQSLRPSIATEDMLAAIAVPPHDAVVRHRDDAVSLDRKIEACRERLRIAGQELERNVRARARLAAEDHAVDGAELRAARGKRDSGWSLIRRRYIENLPLMDKELEAFAPKGADLPGSFEAATAAADELADRRYAHADAAAQITIVSRQIAEQKQDLEDLRSEERRLLDERQALASGWAALWNGVPFEVLSPDAMLEWLRARQEILEAAGRRRTAEQQLQSLRREEEALRVSILAALSAIGAAPKMLERQPLSAVIEVAAAIHSEYQELVSQRRRCEDALRTLHSDLKRKSQLAAEAQNGWSEWEAAWRASVQVLSLDAATGPEAVASLLDDMDAMRETASEIKKLNEQRIAKILRDIAGFAEEVEALLTATAPDLQGGEPGASMLELERRLDEAERLREQKGARRAAIADLDRRIEESGQAAQQAHGTIRALSEAAAASDIDQLKIAIRNSGSLRNLTSSLALVRATLAAQGDGLSIEELAEECATSDIDQVVAREEVLEHDLKTYRASLTEATEKRAEARRVLSAYGGEARAAEAAAVRQSAAAEMREIAERYVRVRTSAAVLRWAIERFRREKQAPLLKRASDIFAALTVGSFAGLRLDYDGQDNLQLAGQRAEGKPVHAGSMSSGTADQLYLALRIASIEDYLSRAKPLPLIVDDLFINFDNDRAAAGLKMLGQLSRLSQVLFFTHHEHLVDIARTALGSTLHVISLEQRPSAIAA